MKHNDYRDFFSDLAKKHKAILHLDERPRFFAWDKDFMMDNQSRIQYPAMMLSPLGGSIRDNRGDRITDTKQGGFAILCKPSATKGSMEARDAAYDEAFQIGMDFIAKIKELAVAGNCRGLSFDLSRVSYELIDHPWLDNTYGYAFMLPLRSPISLTVNPERWLP